MKSTRLANGTNGFIYGKTWSFHGLEAGLFCFVATVLDDTALWWGYSDGCNQYLHYCLKSLYDCILENTLFSV